MKRLLWFLVGIALGGGLALLIGWEWLPIQRADSSPALMRRDYQSEYIRLTAIAYQVDGNLELAQKRLAVLDPTSLTTPLVDLTERWIQQGKPAEMLVPLVRLARALGVMTPAMQPYVEYRTP